MEITEDNQILEEFIKTEGFSEEKKQEILSSDIVLLPNKGFREENCRLFPSETPRFLGYLRENIKDKKIVIAEEEGEEKLLQLRDYTITLPIINVTLELVKDIGLPLFIDLVTAYLLLNFPRAAKKNKIKTNFELKIDQTKTKKSITLHYAGDYEGIEKAFKPIDVNKLFE